MKRNLLRGMAVLSVVLTIGFSANPPNGRTGAPGDGLCSDCHSAGGQSGGVAITGLPGIIMPGQTYNLTIISTTNTGSTLGGFQMVALHDNGNINAGTLFNPSLGSVVTDAGNGRFYHEHNPAAAFSGGPAIMWTVDWTAPISGPNGNIIFYAASVLANGNGSPSGDGVVTTTALGTYNGSDPLTVSILGMTDATCHGLSDGSAQAEADGGSPPYEFLWENGQMTSNATMLSAGTHSVTLTDGLDDTAVTFVTIDEPAILSGEVAVLNHVNCAGANDGQAISNPSGGTPPFEFLWSTGETTNLITDLAAGIHGLTVSDINGCTDIVQFEITTPSMLEVELVMSTDITCFGFGDGSAAVNGIGGTSPYSYVWSDGQTGANAINVNGDVFVTVTDNHLCTSALFIEISEPNLLEINIISTQDVSCFEGSDGSVTVSVSGGNGANTFLWSDGQTLPTASNLSADVYTCIVSDLNGCQDMIIVNIGQPAAISIDLTITNATGVGVPDGSIEANIVGGIVPYSLSWSNGEMGIIEISNLLPGNYTLTVVDANNCVDSAQATISAGGCTTEVAITPTTSLSCPGDTNGVLTYMTNDLVASVLWSTGSTDNILTPVSAGNYSITITTPSGCTASDSINVFDADTVLPSFVLDTLCLFLDANGMRTLDSLTFFTNLIDNCDPRPEAMFDDLVVNCDDVGLFPMAFTVRDLAGNLGPISLFIRVIDTVAPMVICPVDTTIQNCDSFHYMSPSIFDNCDSVTLTLVSGLASGSVFPSGTTTQVIEARDLHGNLATCSFAITVNSNLDITTTTTDATCAGSDDGTAVIMGTGGTDPYSFIVEPQRPLSSLFPGEYTVELMDATGCLARDSFNINSPDSLLLSSIMITHATAGNFDGMIEIDVVGGVFPYQYLWTKDTMSFSTEEDLINIFAGYYSLTITDNSGCTFLLDSILVDEMVATDDQVSINDQINIYVIEGTLTAQTFSPDALYSLHLIDVQGRLLKHQSAWRDQIQVNCQDLAAGIYFVQLMDENGQLLVKSIFIK